MISKYFDDIKQIIEKYNYIVENFQFTEKSYSEERGYIDGEICFNDESRLEFTEVKDIEIEETIKYRYHYMDSNNEIIFRYDNAKHHPEIETFPHHKHGQWTVFPAHEPSIKEIMAEIEFLVIRK